ncbi:hypothetical protein [Nocardia sp. CA-120079]|uniref:hypothetical protein n=1 Tax=Nocardia sp. CA-120079 TaxID=3239974 RepID=UPI003D953A4E
MHDPITTEPLPDKGLAIYTADTAEPSACIFVGWSETDGALCIQIDTTDTTGRVRINVNDAAVYDGIVFDADPDRSDHHDTVTSYAAELQARLAATLAL